MVQKFADDIKIYSSVKTENQVLQSQESLHKALSWGKDWQMLFNLSKCKVLHIGRNNSKFNYQMNSVSLEKVTEENDVGIILDRSLKSSERCCAAAAKANSVL